MLIQEQYNMQIKICKTFEWSEHEWKTYCVSFNRVFKKQFSTDFFKHKYSSNFCCYSYHALLLDDSDSVIGSCTIIPVKYKSGINDLLIIGQAVDVFINEENRVDPLMLRRMYHKLKSLLIEENIIAVIAVPNATAYPYWKSVVKWKDVGNLTYWMIPVKIGNIKNILKFLNPLSIIFSRIWIYSNCFFSRFFDTRDKNYKYEILDDEMFYENRFFENYHSFIEKQIKCFYRIVDEDGVKTAYLISAKKNNKTSFRALSLGTKSIINQHEVDLILFVGPLNFFQILFFKVPHKFEPKLLPMTCDILRNEDVEKFSDMLDYKNWNFGLFNYDVR